jgi:hypothetical protein
MMNPMGPVLLTTMEINPDLPIRGWSRSQTVSPVISHHLVKVATNRMPAPDNHSMALMPHVPRIRDE